VVPYLRATCYRCFGQTHGSEVPKLLEDQSEDKKKEGGNVAGREGSALLIFSGSPGEHKVKERVRE
jgi:hypothetical protein